MTEELATTHGLQIIEQVSQTGMSVIYKSRQPEIDRVVCVKVLAGNLTERNVQRFRKEAQLLLELQHPNIAQTFQFGFDEERPFLVLEWLEGETLADRISRGPLSSEEAQQIFEPIFAALSFAHERGIIHRDFKPSNIFLSISAGVMIPKLIDFGIAKRADNTDGKVTQTGTLLGSPMYMSPEQCAGQDATIRSDIYSAACVVYEALSGKKPFDAETDFEIMYKHSHDTPELKGLESQPIGVRNLLARALEKDAHKRFDSVDAFWSNLKAELTKPVVRQNFQHSLAGALFAVVLVAGLLAAGLFVAKKKTETKQDFTFEVRAQKPAFTQKDHDDAKVALKTYTARADYKSIVDYIDRVHSRYVIADRYQVELLGHQLLAFTSRIRELKEQLSKEELKRANDHASYILQRSPEIGGGTEVNSLIQVATFYSATGRDLDAEPLFMKALRLQAHRGGYPSYDNDRAWYRTEYAAFLEKHGRLKEAEECRREIVKIQAGIDPAEKRKSLALLAANLLTQRDPKKADEARKIVDDALANMPRASPDEPTRVRLDRLRHCSHLCAIARVVYHGLGDTRRYKELTKQQQAYDAELNTLARVTFPSDSVHAKLKQEQH